MKKICRTIELIKYKCEFNEESISKWENHEFIVCFSNNKWCMACDKYDLRKMLERDHINHIMYIFDMTNRIIINRNVLINTDDLERR